MITYKLTDTEGNVLGTISLEDNLIPTLIMNDVELMLGGSFVLSENKFLNFTVIPVPVKEEAKVVFDTRMCCNLNKTRGPNTDGKMVCPVHCSKCGHERIYEDYCDFCSRCLVDDPCGNHI